MAVTARYVDGVVAAPRDVIVNTGGSDVVILDLATREPVDRWPAGDVFCIPARDNELRIGVAGRPYGARLVVVGYEQVRELRGTLPALLSHQRREGGRQLRVLGLSTAALVSVVVAYVFGVPLLANQIVAVIPPAWEMSLGETARGEIGQLMGEGGSLVPCDTDPQSLANRAIARFSAAVVAGTGTPFTPDIQVVRTDIPNAFALPGGHAFYFSALLDQTSSPDEFAGVMAHEFGHVVHRDGMVNLVANSATGLLIGFILGDMTGLSIAGGLGSALIDSRFSRDAERDADRFAAATAERLGFRASGLGDLLDRIAHDDEMSATFAFLSSHPLTAERRAALAALEAAVDRSTPALPAFTDEEWRAIKAMCAPTGPGHPPLAAVGAVSSLSAPR